MLRGLVLAAVKARDEMSWTHKKKPPLLLKITSDLHDDDLRQVAEVVSGVTLSMFLHNVSLSSLS